MFVSSWLLQSSLEQLTFSGPSRFLRTKYLYSGPGPDIQDQVMFSGPSPRDPDYGYYAVPTSRKVQEAIRAAINNYGIVESLGYWLSAV